MKKVTYDADWWTKDYDLAWEQVKDRLHWDWEKTRQNHVPMTMNSGETASPGSEKRREPPLFQPKFDECEWALRLGIGARLHYGTAYPQWNDQLEQVLLEDCELMDRVDEWEQCKSAIRRGYDYSLIKSQNTSPR